MQRRQRNEARQLLNDRRVNDDRPGVARSAMHDPMPGRNQRLVGEALFKPSQKRCDNILMRYEFRQVVVNEAASGGVLCSEMHPVSDPFILALANEVAPRGPQMSRKERELDA